MIDSIVNLLFRCQHSRLTRPVTPVSKAGVPHGDTYVVCLDCGKQFGYDLKEMRVTKPVDHSAERGVVAPEAVRRPPPPEVYGVGHGGAAGMDGRDGAAPVQEGPERERQGSGPGVKRAGGAIQAGPLSRLHDENGFGLGFAHLGTAASAASSRRNSCHVVFTAETPRAERMTCPIM